MAPWPWIVLSVVVLLAVAALLLVRGGGLRGARLTPLSSLAFAFILAGIIFGDSRAVGYTLMGVGVVLAVADVLWHRRG